MTKDELTALAKQAGHTVIEPRPSLVPLTVSEDWCPDLQGLSLKNSALTVTGKPLDRDLGQLAVKRCAGTQQIQSVLQSGIGCKKLHKINPSRHRQ